MNGTFEPPTGAPVGQPLQLQRSVRVRQWWQLLLVASLVGMLFAGWIWYVTTHTENRFSQLPPGEWGGFDGGRLRVTEVTAGPVVPSQNSIESDPAGPGLQFVVVHGEVETTTADVVCRFDLVSAGGRVWQTQIATGRELDAFCPDTPGTKPVELVYLVPETELGDLAGISPMRYDSRRRVVVGPAA